MESDDVQKHTYVNTIKYLSEGDSSLQSVCPLNGCCRAESACYYIKYQLSCEGCSEAVHILNSSTEPFCCKSRFLTHDNSPDTFVIAKKGRLLHKLASLLCCFFELTALHVGHGHHLAGVWSKYRTFVPLRTHLMPSKLNF